MRVYLRLSLPGCQDLGPGIDLALPVSLTLEASTDSTRRLRTLESCGVGTGRLHPFPQSSKLQAPNGPDRMDPHHIAWKLRTAWPGPRARFFFRRCRQLRAGNRDTRASVDFVSSEQVLPLGILGGPLWPTQIGDCVSDNGGSQSRLGKVCFPRKVTNVWALIKA